MAKSRIQGITIEFDGDAKKLKDALKDVDSQVRQTQSNLKDVDKLLKMDPSNTELLNQKYKDLTGSIDGTKSRLETLKEAEAQMSAKGLQGTAEWDALQREIVETEQKLKSLTKEMENFGSVSAQKVAAAGEKIKDVSAKMGEVGQSLTTHVTLPIVAVGTAAVAAASEFDAGMSKVQALSGATSEELQQLREKALEMGDKTKFSASEAASAMEYMSMAGWKTHDMLDGIEGVMNLAAASGEDLARTSDIVTDALTAFGKGADRAGHFADILAVTSSGANTNVGMMGETFKYAAPIAGSFGYSIEDVALACGLMANSGTKASQAGTTLRGIFTALNGEIKISGKELGTVTIQTANADGSMRDLNSILMDCREAFSHLSASEKASTAEMLVGKTAMTGFLGIMNATDEDVQNLANGLANCEGAAKEMAGTMNDNLAGQMEILKGQLQTLGISFGEILVPVLRDVVSILQSVVSWLNSLDPATKTMIVRIAAIAAAAGPLLLVISKVGGAIGTVMTWAPKIVTAFSKIPEILTTVGGAFKALWAFMLANPITIIIAAIAALVGGFIYLWNNCEEFREFWINLWENIKTAIETAWNAITQFLSTTWTNISTAATNAWNAISQFFSTTWTNITNWFHTALNNISMALSTAWTNITTGIQTAWNAIAAFITTTWENIKQIFSNALATVGAAVSTAWSNISANVTTAMGNIKSFIIGAWDNIKSSIASALSNIASGITNGFNTAKNNVVNALNAIKSTASSIWDGIVNLVRGAVDRLKSLVSFKWELPKLKLPHFSISGSFSLNPPSVPSLSVDWYKKAMDNGMILDSPTIFGAMGGKLLGGGDAGAEAVVGVDSLRGMISDAVAAAAGIGGDITIPVYIGQQRLDTIVVKAMQRTNYKSGGR